MPLSTKLPKKKVSKFLTEFTQPQFWKKDKTKAGFTLIELIVVAAIIGLLTSIILGNLEEARQKARDAKRITELQAFRTALELCYNEYSNYFIDPITTNPSPTSAAFTSGTFESAWLSRCGQFGHIPVDPKSFAALLHTTDDYNHYVIMAQMETPKNQMTPAKINQIISESQLSGWTPNPSYNYIIGG